MQLTLRSCFQAAHKHLLSCSCRHAARASWLLQTECNRPLDKREACLYMRNRTVSAAGPVLPAGAAQQRTAHRLLLHMGQHILSGVDRPQMVYQVSLAASTSSVRCLQCPSLTVVRVEDAGSYCAAGSLCLTTCDPDVAYAGHGLGPTPAGSALHTASCCLHSGSKPLVQRLPGDQSMLAAVKCRQSVKMSCAQLFSPLKPEGTAGGGPRFGGASPLV